VARLTILGPVAQVVAMYAALCKAADTAIAGADGRTRGQLMADTASNGSPDRPPPPQSRSKST
jgi:hypothetical protein